MRDRGWVSLAGLLGLALLPGLASAGGAQTPAPASAEYAGMDTCVTCHEETVAAFKTTPHTAPSRS